MPHKDPAVATAYWKAYYAKHRERQMTDSRTYYAANRERCNANSRRWAEKNPERRKEVARNHYYRRREKYNDWRRLKRTGVSREMYDALMEKQKGLCAICEQPSGRRVLQADHCHSEGKVRGLLCFRCNPALGLLREDPNILRRAIDYLEAAE